MTKKPSNKEEAYEKLHIEDVLEAIRWIRFGVEPGMAKTPAIEYVKHWKAWTKVNDLESYNRIIEVEQISETTP